jgi:hypothetical protein
MDNTSLEQNIITHDHVQIQKWAELRQARPATATDPATDGGPESVLRFDFPPYGEESSQELSWEDFFNEFDENQLALSIPGDSIGNVESQAYSFVARL